ncbi:MAG: aspartate aminotransferase family protein [Phycisphaeraceae bacterium]|nr:aspartate aminotransferase family protein [Phycisphaeraceae bacterium]
MRQWRAPGSGDPLIIEAGEGFELIDTEGNRYIDGVSSLWCNVHGHRAPGIDQAIRAQLDKIAHSTLLGLSSPPAIKLAARLVNLAKKPRAERSEAPDRSAPNRLNKVFFSDCGAAAVEAACKMAVGYWHHRGQPAKCKFIAMGGAYHGDTAGAMSVGFSDLFHAPFHELCFEVLTFPSPDACRPPEDFSQFAIGMGFERCAECQGRDFCHFGVWPSECDTFTSFLGSYALAQLANLLETYAEQTAAIVIEPVMQGAAGMICQPPGFVRRVAEMAHQFDVLLIADEVATGFGRTGAMFACQHDDVTPDLLCLGKGLTGGYLPVAATLATDAIYEAFCDPAAPRDQGTQAPSDVQSGPSSDPRCLGASVPRSLRAFYHGHTYTGNALGCAAALASLDLFEQNKVLANVRANAKIIRERLETLREHPHVLDIRQRGIMVGIELTRDRDQAQPFDFTARTGHAICAAMRAKGLIIRPLGDVIVLMPAPAMPPEVLHKMLDIVIETLNGWKFD